MLRARLFFLVRAISTTKRTFLLATPLDVVVNNGLAALLRLENFDEGFLMDVDFADALQAPLPSSIQDCALRTGEARRRARSKLTRRRKSEL